jgi:excisionase family DNA binding protein
MKTNKKANFDEFPDLLNVTEMSRMLNVSVKTAYRLLKSREVKHIKIGREYRIPKIHLLDYLLIPNA